jgi:hypothetical protein
MPGTGQPSQSSFSRTSSLEIRATLVASAAVSTATTATATATTSATSTAATFFTGPRFVDVQSSTIVFMLVESGDRSLGLFVGTHFHETEAFATPRFAISNHVRVGDCSKL